MCSLEWLGSSRCSLERSFPQHINDIANDKYMIPASNCDTPTAAFAAHEPRMYELENAAKRPRVTLQLMHREPDFVEPIDEGGGVRCIFSLIQLTCKQVGIR